MNLPKNTPPVKMSRRQAKLLWDNMTPEQKFQFNKMFGEIQRGELMIKEVNVNVKEEVQNIVLESKEKPSKPIEPFAEHFDVNKRKVDIIVD